MSVQKMFIQAITNLDSDNAPDERPRSGNSTNTEIDAASPKTGPKKRKTSGSANKSNPVHKDAASASGPSQIERKRERMSTDNPISARDMIIRLNPTSARYAVILSEIIGQPVSRRQRRTQF